MTIPQSFQLSELTGDPIVIERLKSLGFHQNQKLKFIGRAPFSGPFLIRMNSMVLALREDEARCLKVEAL